MGRSHELGERAKHMQSRWERHGRIVHRPSSDDLHVMDRLLYERRFSVDVSSGCEAPPPLQRCDEVSCMLV